jgi:hypothetical protein
LREPARCDLSRLAFRASGERMMTLGSLLDLMAGRVALFVELNRIENGGALCRSGHIVKDFKPDVP